MTLVVAIEEALAPADASTIDRFFFDWRGGRPPDGYDGFDEVARR